jgi:hypothetical protein
LERGHTTLHALPEEFVLHGRKKKNDARTIHNQTDKEAKQTLQIRKKKNDARTIHKQTDSQSEQALLKKNNDARIMHRQTSKQNNLCK